MEIFMPKNNNLMLVDEYEDWEVSENLARKKKEKFIKNRRNTGGLNKRDTSWMDEKVDE